MNEGIYPCTEVIIVYLVPELPQGLRERDAYQLVDPQIRTVYIGEDDRVRLIELHKPSMFETVDKRFGVTTFMNYVITHRKIVRRSGKHPFAVCVVWPIPLETHFLVTVENNLIMPTMYDYVVGDNYWHGQTGYALTRLSEEADINTTKEFTPNFEGMGDLSDVGISYTHYLLFENSMRAIVIAMIETGGKYSVNQLRHGTTIMCECSGGETPLYQCELCFTAWLERHCHQCGRDLKGLEFCEECEAAEHGTPTATEMEIASKAMACLCGEALVNGKCVMCDA